MRLSRSKYDRCFYYFCVDDMFLFLLLYVEDMLVISESKSKVNELKKVLNFMFDMKDLGCANKILGVVVQRNREERTLKVNQKSYLQKVVTKFGMKSYKLVSIPLASHFNLSKQQCPKIKAKILKMENVSYANMIRLLMYSMISTRLDLDFSILLLSKYMFNPCYDHWYALKWLLKFVSSNIYVGLFYQKRLDILSLEGFVDYNFAEDKDSRKFTTTYISSHLEEIVLIGSYNFNHYQLYVQQKLNMWA